MTNEEILEELKHTITLKKIPQISQENLDELFDFCIQNNLKERAWRIALSYSNFTNYSFAKLVDYYINERDAYYLQELIYAVGEDKVELKKTYKKILDTKNKEFIENMHQNLMGFFVVSSINELEDIINSYN